MLRFSLLSSGSKGNALLIATPAAKVLIDNGLSFKELSRRAAALGEGLDDLRAVVVTHEHRDHVNGVGVLARKLRVPVYITEETHAALPPTVGKLPHYEFFASGDAIPLDGMSLESFQIAHDAVDPVGFVVRFNGTKLGLATDLGHVSHLVRNRLAGCHALIIESNHCPGMLARGPYPPPLRQRIRSKHGHLSNADMCSLLASLVHEGLRVVVLGHVSEENNAPDLVHEMATRAIGSHTARVCVASQNQPTPLFEIAL